MVTTSPFNVMESPLKEQIENEKQGTSSSTHLSKTKDAHGSLFKRMTDAGVQSPLCSTHVSLQILISVLSSIVTSLRNYPSCGRLRNMFDPLMSTALLVRDIHLRRFVRWINERMGSPTISIDRGVSKMALLHTFYRYAVWTSMGYLEVRVADNRIKASLGVTVQLRLIGE